MARKRRPRNRNHDLVLALHRLGLLHEPGRRCERLPEVKSDRAWDCYGNQRLLILSYSISRSGVFDWILGRQLEGWPYTRRVIRDYTGMSLRGLAWTAPTGYALYYMGYGWQYALSGSLMAIFYFAGAHTQIRSSALENDFGAGVPASEFYWGAFIWLALAFSAVARITEHFLKKWEREARRRDRASDAYPRPSYKRSRWTKAKFGRKASAVVYELTMGAINCVFAASVVFYALVAQDDVRNKGQTFFGIFTAFLFLLTCQTFTMGRAWTLARVRKATAAAAKERRRSSAEVRAKISVGSRNHFSRTNSGAMGAPDPFGAPFLGRTIVPVDEALPTYQEIESMEEAPRVITINDEESGEEDYSGLRAYRAGIEPERPKSFAWDFVEILHMAAGWIRNLVGLLGMLATCVTFLLCLFAAAWNAHTPRFIQTNSTTCEQAPLYEIFSG